jgi:ribosome maturation factor RimP
MPGLSRQVILGIAASVAERHSVCVYHLRVGQASIEVQIDSATGVSHSDCAAYSRALRVEIEARGQSLRQHRLEVSSPGIERGLFEPRHFAAVVGAYAQVRTRSGTTLGLVAAADDVAVTLDAGRDRTAPPVRIAYSEITSARVRVADTELLKRPAQGSHKPVTDASEARRSAVPADGASKRQHDRQVVDRRCAAGPRSGT